MKNIIKYIFVILISFFICIDFDVYALDNAVYSNDNIKNDYSVTRMRRNTSQDQESDCEYILGDPDDESSVAYMIQRVFDYIKVIGPIAVILLSGFDFAKNALSPDAENMKKITKKLVTRLLCAVALYFVPLLTGFILSLVNNSAGNCGIN